MNTSMFHRQLYWKEFRQTLPLVIVLIAVAALLHFIGLSGESAYENSVLHLGAFLGLPILFSAGAGALLIGQEKDLRTLHWLRSLPIPNSVIVLSKTFAATLGLLVCWVISFLIYALVVLVDPMAIRLPTDSVHLFLAYMAQSFLILFGGIATAWYAQTAFRGLLGVAAILMVQILLTWVFAIWYWPGDGFSVANAITQFLFIAFSIAAVGLLGLRGLSAARASSRASNSSLSSAVDSKAFFISQPHSKLNALLWQMAVQNRWTMVIIMAFCLPMIVLFLTYYPDEHFAAIFVLPCLGSFLAIMWLGTLVFQGDSFQQRHRFLADRGVSPAAVWLSRQLVPFAVLCSLILVVTFAAWTKQLGILEWAFVAAGIFCLQVPYLYSQWLGMLVRSQIVAAIAAPAISALVLSYFQFHLLTVGTPWWLCFAIQLVPLLVTFFLTRNWMDGTIGIKFWSINALAVVVLVIVPFLPYWTIVIAHRTAAKAEVDFASEVKPFVKEQNEQEQIASLFISKFNFSEQNGKTRQRTLTVYEALDNSIAYMEAQMPSVSGRLVAPTRESIEFIQKNAELCRMRTQSDGNAEDKDRYRRLFRMQYELASHAIEENIVRVGNSVDFWLIWMTREFLVEDAGALLEPAFQAEVIAFLQDKQLRNNFRRVCIAGHWSSLIEAPESYFKKRVSHADWIDWWRLRIREEERFAHLWHAIERQQSGIELSESDLRQFAELQDVSPEFFGQGNAGKYLRIDDARFFNTTFVPRYLGAQWFAGWERQLSQLKVKEQGDE